MQRPRYPPNPPLGGLPSGPRARPIGTATPRREEGSSSAASTYAQRPSYDAPSTVGPNRSLRQQRSLASLPAQSDRGRNTDTARPPLPPAPAGLRSRSAARPSRAEAEDEGRQRASSSSSSSSNGSSLMERMKVRSGDTTPRTSIDDDDGKREWPRRQAGGRREEAYSDDRDQQKEEPAVPAPGVSVWDRLTSAAGNLTISVGQAWATNVSLQSGEETPPGGESRLTRAMKAYHLQQARSPADLPDWLFEPHERGARSASAPARRSADEDDVSRGSAELPPPRSRGFRDIYESQAPVPPSSSRSRFDNAGQLSSSSSTATNRLKALRDAKRQANGGTMGRELMVDAPRGRAQEEYRQPVSLPSAPARRVGLPMGPARRVGPVAA